MSSRQVVDLRKKKAGATRPLPFNWGARAPRSKTARRSPLRERRRRVRALIVLAVLLVIGAGAYGVSWASYLPQFSIEEISVVGAKELRPELVQAYAETVLSDGRYSLLSSKNIFLYPRERMEQSVAEHFPRTRSVRVSRESFLAQTIIVTIEEREPFARWCSPREEGGMDECYLLDETGFLFTSAASSTLTTGYVFRGALPDAGSAVGQTFLPEKFSEVAALLQDLERKNFSPAEISVEETRDIFIMLARGFELRVSLDSLEGAVRNFELVLASDALRGKESELEYVDLRFGNRVYYKFSGAEQQVQ